MGGASADMAAAEPGSWSEECGVGWITDATPGSTLTEDGPPTPANGVKGSMASLALFLLLLLLKTLAARHFRYFNTNLQIP